MERAKYLSGRLRELFLDGHWIANTNYQELIKQVNIEVATKRIGTLNTIAELVYHIQYYLVGLCNVLKGEPLTIKDTLSFSMPPMNREEDWLTLKHTFINSATQFIIEVSNMDNSMFDENFVEEKYGTWERNIEGVIEHGYYHLGQLSLIRKMILEKEKQ